MTGRTHSIAALCAVAALLTTCSANVFHSQSGNGLQSFRASDIIPLPNDPLIPYSSLQVVDLPQDNQPPAPSPPSNKPPAGAAPSSQQCTHVDTTVTGGQPEIPCSGGAACVSVLPMCLNKDFQLDYENCHFRQGAIMGCVLAAPEEICTGESSNGAETDVSQLLCPAFWTDPTGRASVMSHTYFPGAEVTAERGHCRVRRLNDTYVNQCIYVFPTPPEEGCRFGYSKPAGVRVCSIAPTACWNMANPSENFCSNPTDNKKPVHGACIPTQENGRAECVCNMYEANDGSERGFTGCPAGAGGCYELCKNECYLESDDTCGDIVPGQDNGGSSGSGGGNGNGGGTRDIPFPPSPGSGGNGGSPSPPAPAPTSDTGDQDGDVALNNDEKSSGDSDSSGTPVWVFVLIGVVAVAAIVAGVFFYRKKSQSDDEEDDEENEQVGDSDYAAM